MRRNLFLVMALIWGGTLVQAETRDELFAKGLALESQFKTPEALAVFLELEKQEPDNVEVIIEVTKQYSYLVADLKTNRAEDRAMANLAMKYAQKAYNMEPNRWDTNLGMAITYGLLAGFVGNKEKVAIAKTIKIYADRAVALNPTSDYAHHVVARWNQELASMNAIKAVIANAFLGGLPKGSYDDALAEYEIARKLRPDRLIHQVEYGRTLIMMGRKEEGIRELEKGLAMPNSEHGDPGIKVRGRKTLDGG